jgi:transposase
MSCERKPSASAAIELPTGELVAMLDRARTGAMSEEDYAVLKEVVHKFGSMKTELQDKNTSIKRLQQMLFGADSEKTHKVLKEAPRSGGRSGKKRPIEKGHGRNGAAAYTGAEKKSIPHPRLRPGDPCPESGCKGKLYQFVPTTQVRVRGMAPLNACVYECEQLRCALCNELFKAPAPEGIGEEKYDESVAAMVALLKYGTGLPFYRLEKLQESLGIPLPASTQWDLIKGVSPVARLVHEVLIGTGAQGELFHNDDTGMRILELTDAQRIEILGKGKEGRTGTFTSGIISVVEGRRIALFFTGVRHAGENLTEVLKKRAAQLAVPAHMSDGQRYNSPAEEFKTLTLKCLVHSRRRYVEVVKSFPEEVRFVLNLLRKVYLTDARAHREGLNPGERMKLHQRWSGPRMRLLERWMAERFSQRLIEPNSGLGGAIKYMQKNWEPLTAFLRVAGAPLDNNICERALKKAILHRKNALFYKTLKGAEVGDGFMSLIYTAELNDINPFEYLVALFKHPEAVEKNPAGWLPWNYQRTLAGVSATGPPA